MRSAGLWVAIGVAAAGVAVAATAQDKPLFKASIKTVPVYATVVDQSGRLVPDLVRDDFTILDNGKPVELTLFSNEPQPFTAVVMLDTSASMTNSLKLLNRAAEQFILRLLPVDRAQVGAFNDKIQLSGTFTSDRDDLVAALDDLQFGNPTRLNDAVATSLDALQGLDGRRVILLFSDGEDTGSRVRFRTVLERARDEEVMVYAIGLESEFFNGMRIERTRRPGTCVASPRKPAAGTSSSRKPTRWRRRSRAWRRSSGASIFSASRRPPSTTRCTSSTCASAGPGPPHGHAAAIWPRRTRANRVLGFRVRAVRFADSGSRFWCGVREAWGGPR